MSLTDLVGLALVLISLPVAVFAGWDPAMYLVLVALYLVSF